MYSHDEFVVLDPLLPAAPSGSLIKFLAGEDKGEQPGSMRVQVVGDLQDLALARASSQVLDLRDDVVRFVMPSHELPEPAVQRIIREDVIAPVRVVGIAALWDRRVQRRDEQEVE